jgi:hypothetical protein
VSISPLGEDKSISSKETNLTDSRKSFSQYEPRIGSSVFIGQKKNLTRAIASTWMS